VAIREHNRDALRPGLVEVRRDSTPRSWLRCGCAPRVDRKSPGDPRLVDVFVPTIGGCRQYRHLLPPQGGLAGELAPLLLPGGVSIQREDQLPYLARPVPPPTLDAENRHHTRHTDREQRQRIKGAFADPQRPGACLQRRGVEIPLRARKVIVPLGFGRSRTRWLRIIATAPL